ncbi:MAG: hypothetical protein ACON5A_01390 [Candidatus Comchoanobacterales bacterium]
MSSIQDQFNHLRADLNLFFLGEELRKPLPDGMRHVIATVNFPITKMTSWMAKVPQAFINAILPTMFQIVFRLIDITLKVSWNLISHLFWLTINCFFMLAYPLIRLLGKSFDKTWWSFCQDTLMITISFLQTPIEYVFSILSSVVGELVDFFNIIMPKFHGYGFIPTEPQADNIESHNIGYEFIPTGPQADNTESHNTTEARPIIPGIDLGSDSPMSNSSMSNSSKKSR